MGKHMAMVSNRGFWGSWLFGDKDSLWVGGSEMILDDLKKQLDHDKIKFKHFFGLCKKPPGFEKFLEACSHSLPGEMIVTSELIFHWEICHRIPDLKVERILMGQHESGAKQSRGKMISDDLRQISNVIQALENLIIQCGDVPLFRNLKNIAIEALNEAWGFDQATIHLPKE